LRIAVCRPRSRSPAAASRSSPDDLVAELRRRGHDADLVSVPFKWYPGERVLTQTFLWRLVDLEEADGRRIDLVIATKFPSYVVRHRTRSSGSSTSSARRTSSTGRRSVSSASRPRSRAIRRKVQQLDRIALGEARKVFATSRNVADRLERSTGIAAELMPHPPQELPYRCDEYGDFVLSVGRLDRAKRIDLLIEAAAKSCTPLVIAGDGPDRERLESLADGNVRFAGRVSEEELTDLYARCLAVFYAPVDEDFGMVPYEAFLADKPVVTTTDAAARSRSSRTA
jgi:glycosyltransferase involved in cell wall biosynthesis